MKLYLLAPVLAANSDEDATNARFETCSAQIAELIVSHLANDPALFGMRHVREIAAPPVKPGALYGDVETVRIADAGTLRTILRHSGRPDSGQWMLIRSLVSCRAVFYGYDGQAFVCLPSSAPAIVSPDEAMIPVEECSHMLIETDFLDGMLLD